EDIAPARPALPPKLVLHILAVGIGEPVRKIERLAAHELEALRLAGMNMLVPDRPLIAEPGKLDGELFGRRRADDLVERLMQRIVHLPARIFLKRRKARLQGKVRLIARRKKSAGVDDDADRDP